MVLLIILEVVNKSIKNKFGEVIIRHISATGSVRKVQS